MRHPALTPVDAPAFGRNLEARLAELIRQNGIPQLESAGIIQVQTASPGAGTSRDSAVHAVAKTLYRGLTANVSPTRRK